MRVVTAVCACALLAACGHGPKGLSSADYEGMKHAAEAIDKAAESRDQPNEFYEARFLEAQRSQIEVKDVSASGVVELCVSSLKIYRLRLHMVSLAVDAMDRGGKNARADYAAARANREDASRGIDSCITKVRSYL